MAKYKKLYFEITDPPGKNAKKYDELRRIGKIMGLGLFNDHKYVIILKNGEPVAGISFFKPEKHNYLWIQNTKGRDPRRFHFMDLILEVYEEAERRKIRQIEGYLTIQGETSIRRMKKEIGLEIEIDRKLNSIFGKKHFKIIVRKPVEILRRRLRGFEKRFYEIIEKRKQGRKKKQTNNKKTAKKKRKIKRK